MKFFSGFCLIVVIVNFDNQILSAFIIKNDNYSQISLFSDGQNTDFRLSKDSGSWLQMVLIFAKEQTSNLIERITNVMKQPNLTNETTAEITTTTAKQIESVCQSQFIPIDKFCYFFSNTTSNWSNAQESCKSKGAELAHPNTEEKNTQLVNYIITNFPTIDSKYIYKYI
ncbi:Fc fragment of IgE, low affinity II, receptor for (CD23), variant 2 [Chamberlinius hualienensis]